MDDLPDRAVEATEQWVSSPLRARHIVRDALATGHVQAFTREELGLILFWAEELEYEQSKPARKAHRYLDAMGENDG